MHGKVRYSTVF